MPPAKRSPSARSTSSSSSGSSAKRTTTGSRSSGARGTQAAASTGAKATATTTRKAAGRTTAQAKSGAAKTTGAAKSGAAKTTRAARSSGAGAAAKAAGRATTSTAKAAAAGAKGTATAATAGAKNVKTSAKAATTRTRRAAAGSDGITSIAEQLAKGTIKPRDVVMLTRDRIQATLDDAAARGRVTRKDANALVAELVRHGRTQGDDLVGEVEGLVGRGRAGVESATKRARHSPSVDRLVRGADKARRSVGVGPSFPILGYDELNAPQVRSRIKDLKKPELRRVLTYERKHANRKSVVGPLEKSLA